MMYALISNNQHYIMPTDPLQFVPQICNIFPNLRQFIPILCPEKRQIKIRNRFTYQQAKGFSG